MKEQLKELWYAPSERAAKRRWGQWFRQAMESGLEPLMTFARRLKPYMHGIVASATASCSTLSSRLLCMVGGDIYFSRTLCTR